MTLRTCVCVLLLATFSRFVLADTIPAGPDYPAPGGNSYSSSGSPGDPGGVTANYSAFDVSGLTGLWQGLWDTTTPTAGLDGSAHLLTFSSVSGSTGTWTGTTSWTDPDTSTFYSSIPLKMDISITAGTPTWSTLPIAGYTFPAIGAVIDNSAGGDYSINIQFSADTGGGFVPLNTVRQASGGDTNSSISLGFYSVAVPEPSSVVLCGLGMFGVAGFAIRKRRYR